MMVKNFDDAAVTKDRRKYVALDGRQGAGGPTSLDCD